MSWPGATPLPSEKTRPGDPKHRVAALVFDLDGTLYRQRPVRIRMMQRLALRSLQRPGEMARVWRVLSAYRRAQETMRANCTECASIADEQIRMACRSTGLPEDLVASHVSEWMEQSPLDLLRPAMYEGIEDLLRAAKQQGIRLAVFSDYPAAAKLEHMGLDRYFDVVLCAQDAGVQRFKPDPRGLQIILERLQVSRDETIYIGDRPEVDGRAAASAGVRCFILGRQAGGDQETSWRCFSSYSELARLLNLESPRT